VSPCTCSPAHCIYWPAIGVVSDGKTHRGTAFIDLTFKSTLSSQSNISHLIKIPSISSLASAYEIIYSPNGFFWIILLRTDRLEELFGILRTIVGNDANLDMLQLRDRITRTTEVSNTLAKYPQWDRGPRRLRLPAFSKDSTELPDNVDHIKPASWRGDVTVRNVILLTCWNRGRRMAENEDCRVSKLLKAAGDTPAVTILAP